MKVEYHPLTVIDLNSAAAYYNASRAGLGDELRAEVYSAIARVLAGPRQFAIVEHDLRRCLVHRFPYSVLFRMTDEQTVRVLAIRHHRRHARFGLARR